VQGAKRSEEEPVLSRFSGGPPTTGKVSGTIRWQFGEIPIALGRGAPFGVVVPFDAIRFRPVAMRAILGEQECEAKCIPADDVFWDGRIALGQVLVDGHECSLPYTVDGLPLLLTMQLRVEPRNWGRFVQTTQPSGFILSPEQPWVQGVNFIFQDESDRRAG
jgi:hypothetical protein